MTKIKDQITDSLRSYPLFTSANAHIERKEVIALSNHLRSLMIPSFYRTDSSFEDIYAFVAKMIHKAYAYKNEVYDKTITDMLFERFSTIISQLAKDLEFFYESDPACESREEIILAYPGFYAILIYRLAHAMYDLKIPYLPRMMSELAHSATGIDINPGAKIDESFFIDHGTGVVIGETVIIGKRVKVYQGVTLGAISTDDAGSLKGVKRHPTIEDNVTIYANATVLGGKVVIGKNSVIGGNAFIIKSIPADSLAMVKNCGLIIRSLKESNDA